MSKNAGQRSSDIFSGKDPIVAFAEEVTSQLNSGMSFA